MSSMKHIGPSVTILLLTCWNSCWTQLNLSLNSLGTSYMHDSFSIYKRTFFFQVKFLITCQEKTWILFHHSVQPKSLCQNYDSKNITMTKILTTLTTVMMNKTDDMRVIYLWLIDSIWMIDKIQESSHLQVKVNLFKLLMTQPKHDTDLFS